MPPPPTAWASDTPRPKQKPRKKAAHDASPKSVQARQLERLISSLDALSAHPPTRDPRGGCFCLARNHPLSAHTPLCTSCGLILCSLNHPYHLCPSLHCPSPNLLPSLQHRANLLTNLRHQLSIEIQKEEDLKLKLAEEKKKQAGAFPSLQSTSTPNPKAVAQQTTHKVLSITSSSQSKKNKKVVTLSTQPSPSSSVPPSRTESPSLSADDDSRLPEPPNSVIHAHPPPSQILKSRPWRNFTLSLDDSNASVDIKYVPPNP